MKILFLFPFLLFQTAFSQTNNPISFLHLECTDEVMSGVSKNELHEYWSFFDIGNFHQNYYYVEKFNKSDSKKPIFFLKGLNLEKGIVVGKWIDRMIFPGDHEYLTIPNLEDEKNSNSYYIYAKGNLIEKENNEFPYFDRLDNYELRVVINNKNSLIFSLDSINAWPAGGFEGGVTLYWIGDLNGDKQIDIILGATSDYRYNSYILLLSNDNPDEMFTRYEAGGCSSC